MSKSHVIRRLMLRHQLYIIATVAALCGLLFGFDTGIISGASIFIRHDFHLSGGRLEMVVSAVLFGAMCGSMLSGRATDRFGRRNMMLVTALLFVVGTCLAALAPSLAWLVTGRGIIGLAIGVACYAAPLYLSEISPAAHRGALVVLNTIMVTGGIVVAYVVSMLCAGSANWRLMFGLGVVPAGLLLAGVFLLPKSPRWLIEKGDMQQALRVLHKLRPSEQIAQQEWQQIAQSVAEQPKTNWRALFAGRVFWLLVVGCGLAIIQQITGINTILYYAPSIFSAAGFHGVSAQLMATLGMGLTNFLFTLVALKLVDKVGRRRLLLWGLTIMTLSLFIVSLCFHAGATLAGGRWYLLCALVCFIASYALSIGCLFWLLIAEIYPLNVRGGAMSIAASCNWLANFAVAATFLSLLHAFGPRYTFLLYAVLSVLSVVFCYALVPETRGISLEQMESRIGNKNIALRKLGDV